MKILVTSCAGFIGSAIIRHLINNTEHSVINAEKLTHAGGSESLTSVCDTPRYNFEKINTCNKPEVRHIFSQYQSDIVMPLTSNSSPTNRSIVETGEFIQTNSLATYTLAEAIGKGFTELSEPQKTFHFHHISTDEVYGDVETPEGLFTEKASHTPSSPYSVSKASSDNLVRAWNRTFGLPTVLANCSKTMSHSISLKINSISNSKRSSQKSPVNL